IASRLERHLGAAADRVRRGTIHAFCAELLREFGSHVNLEAGFGIADEDYQRIALGRLGVPARWQGNTLKRFAAYRFRGEPLHPSDAPVFRKYESYLTRKRVVDFDQLVLKTAELLATVPAVGEDVRRRWDHVLVDEFQDL